MRIVVWNCRMALGRKLPALLELQPDVVVLPGATSPDGLSLPTAADLSYDWIGGRPSKGLGVLACSPYRVSRGCAAGRAPAVGDAPPGNRPGGDVHPARRVGHEPSRHGPLRRRSAGERSVAYLLGSSGVRACSRCRRLQQRRLLGQTDGRHPKNFATTAKMLEAFDLVSAYHESLGVAFGGEPDPTLHWQTQRAGGRTYHITASSHEHGLDELGRTLAATRSGWRAVCLITGHWWSTSVRSRSLNLAPECDEASADDRLSAGLIGSAALAASSAAPRYARNLSP